MSIVTLAEIAQFQADAESLMWDTCSIDRASDNPASSARVLVYAGKCRWRDTSRVGRTTPGPAGTPAGRDAIEVHIPISVTGVKFNDRVTLTASTNPSLVNDVVYVADLFSQSLASAQRLSCERRLR